MARAGRNSGAKKVTSRRVARVASKLQDGRYSKAAKKPAGSALAQYPGRKK